MDVVAFSSALLLAAQGAFLSADESRSALALYALGALAPRAPQRLRRAVSFSPATPGVAPSPPAQAADADEPADARAVALVDLDCDVQQRHFEAAFARRAARWRVARRARRGGRFDESERAALRVEEYETTPWELIMGEVGSGGGGSGGGGGGGGGGGVGSSAAVAVAVGASNFCVRKGLGRKAVMAEALQAHAGKCGAACPLRAALPETVVVDTMSVFHSRPRWLDFRSALAESLAEAEAAMDAAAAAAVAAAGPAPLWILKPSITNKGEGLRIVAAAVQVAEAVCEAPELGTWVLQRYVDAPLLLRPGGGGGGSVHEGGGHKFHLRVYVLAAGALSVHVFREALVLLALRPYSRASALDPAQRAAHVTNTCVGQEEGGDDFDENLHVCCSDELAALLLASGAAASAAEADARVDAIFASVREAVAHSFRAMEGRVGLYLPLPAPSFELYGVDFLVDAAFRVVLLEFNPTPDLRMTGSRLDGLVGRLVDGVVAIATGEAPGAESGAFDCVYAKEWPKKGSIKVT